MSKKNRRSLFKVNVHFGEHTSPEAAIAAWSQEVGKLRELGKNNKAEKMERKLDELWSLS
jgi:hypothetical protein